MNIARVDAIKMETIDLEWSWCATLSPTRIPIPGICKFKSVSGTLAERAKQCTVKLGEEVVFLPTHTSFKSVLNERVHC